MIGSEMKMNQKMICLIESRSNENKSEILQFEFVKLKDLFFQNFVTVADCVIISNQSQQLLTKQFDNALKMYLDKTGYEAGNTEIRINDFLENPISVLDAIELAFLVIECWAFQLINRDIRSKTCFILSCDGDYVTLRFHITRENENMWLMDSLEDYKEPVGYIII